MDICKGYKKNGTRCNYKSKNNGYCMIHSKNVTGILPRIVKLNSSKPPEVGLFNIDKLFAEYSLILLKLLHYDIIAIILTCLGDCGHNCDCKNTPYILKRKRDNYKIEIYFCCKCSDRRVGSKFTYIRRDLNKKEVCSRNAFYCTTCKS